MNHGSLFSGIGGFDLAARWMGWRNIFQAEINPFCRRLLAHHFPEAIQFGDIKKLKGEPFYGAIDIISGGFPCQPFSIAGRRRGKTDDRYLWPEAIRVIREIQPTWIVLENVAGLLSILEPESMSEMEIQTAELYYSDKVAEGNADVIRLQRRIIGTIIGEIHAAGYILPRLSDGTPVILCIPACAVGAPHRRDRIWIVAYTNNAGSHEPEVGSRNCKGGNRSEARPKTTCEPPRRGGSSTGTITSDTYGQFREPTPGSCGEKYQQEWYSLREHPATAGRCRTTSDANGFQPQGGTTRREAGRQNDTLAHFIHGISGIPGKTSQLSPRFVCEMMGFPPNWMVSPFHGGAGKA